MSSSFTKHEDCHGKHPYFLFKKEKEKKKKHIFSCKAIKEMGRVDETTSVPHLKKKKKTKKQTNKQTL